MHQKQPPANVAVAVSLEKTGIVAFVSSSETGVPEQVSALVKRTIAIAASLIDILLC
jgi:hypothetical protein